MDILAEATLVKKDGEQVNAKDVLEDKEVIAFYFSAHWCPPCKAFTPVLADFYEELSDANKPFEIIFVSSDRSPEAMLDYMKESHGDWPAVQHGSPESEQLTAKFGVQGIPMLIVIKKDGQVVSENGRGDVQSKGAKAFDEWSNK